MAVIINSQKSIDFNSGVKTDIEFVDGKLRLKLIGQTTGPSRNTIVPPMTSNTSPKPFVASASSIYNGRWDAWKAFNGANIVTDDRWASANSGPPQWLKIDLGEPKKIIKYAIIVVFAGGDQNPKSWTIEGSNDNSNWFTIGSVANESTWVAGERREYYITSPNLFRYYRITISQTFGGNICTIGELELFEETILEEFAPSGSAEFDVDLGFYFRQFSSLQIDKTTFQDMSVNVYTSTSNDRINYTPYSLIDSDGNIISPQGRYIKIKVELIGNNTSDGKTTETPYLTSLSINYKELDKQFSGLMFMDTSQQYYSTSIGEILQYLDFNTMISGQTSLDVKVILTNTYPFNVKNIRLTTETDVEGLTIELSKSNNPFVAENYLIYDQQLNFDETIEFYVRLSTSDTAVGSGTFDIKVEADPV